MKPKYKYSVRECLIKFIGLVRYDFYDAKGFGEVIRKLSETVPQKSWKPRYDDEYYFIDDWGELTSTCWMDYSSDEFRYDTGNCFPYTKEGYKQAKAYRQKLIDLWKEE